MKMETGEEPSLPVWGWGVDNCKSFGEKLPIFDDLSSNKLGRYIDPPKEHQWEGKEDRQQTHWAGRLGAPSRSMCQHLRYCLGWVMNAWRPTPSDRGFVAVVKPLCRKVLHGDRAVMNGQTFKDHRNVMMAIMHDTV